MRGWRRLVSEYGFEGAFRSENVVKVRNASLCLFGSVLATTSVLVIFLRLHSTTALPVCSVRASPNSHPNEKFRGIMATLRRQLEDTNLSWSDIVSAASRMAPIESQLCEVAEIIGRIEATRRPSTRQEMEEIIESTPAGPVVRKIALEAFAEIACSRDFADHIIKQLVEHWWSNGYFKSESYPRREAFGSRQTSEAIGVDIGSTVKTALSDDSSLQQLSGEYMPTALLSLQQFGFVHIREVVSVGVLERLRESLSVTGRPSAEVGEALLSQDANISHSRASPNRLQLVLRGSKIEEITSCIHSAISPLITSFYDRRGVRSRVVLSDLRLVVLDHAAHELPWTAYNPRGGVSVMIPLQSFDGRSGSHAFLPGSHLLLEPSMNIFRKIQMFVERYLIFKRPTAITDLSLDGSWRAGDAFVFDNRLLMRGTENSLFRSRSYILAVYETIDESSTPFFLRGKVLFRFAQYLTGISILT